ncbi:hypothetical protein KI387_012145, partial [Taxus chinensis]
SNFGPRQDSFKPMKLGTAVLGGPSLIPHVPVPSCDLLNEGGLQIFVKGLIEDIAIILYALISGVATTIGDDSRISGIRSSFTEPEAPTEPGDGETREGGKPPPGKRQSGAGAESEQGEKKQHHDDQQGIQAARGGAGRRQKRGRRRAKPTIVGKRFKAQTSATCLKTDRLNLDE